MTVIPWLSDDMAGKERNTRTLPKIAVLGGLTVVSILGVFMSRPVFLLLLSQAGISIVMPMALIGLACLSARRDLMREERPRAIEWVALVPIIGFSLFAVQGYGLDEVEAAQLVALGAWVRPFAALGAGLLGDRIGVSRLLVICFVLLLASNLYFAFTTPGVVWVLLGNVLLAAVAICGLRGLYFAVFEEQRVPAIVTGTAVGLVSVVGYTPDIFVTLVAGILIDRSPGLAGHQHFFMFLAAFAAVGVLVSLALARRAERIRAPEADDLAREQAAVNAG